MVARGVLHTDLRHQVTVLCVLYSVQLLQNMVLTSSASSPLISNSESDNIQPSRTSGMDTALLVSELLTRSSSTEPLPSPYTAAPLSNIVLPSSVYSLSTESSSSVVRFVDNLGSTVTSSSWNDSIIKMSSTYRYSETTAVLQSLTSSVNSESVILTTPLTELWTISSTTAADRFSPVLTSSIWPSQPSTVLVDDISIPMSFSSTIYIDASGYPLQSTKTEDIIDATKSLLFSESAFVSAAVSTVVPSSVKHENYTTKTPPLGEAALTIPAIIGICSGAIAVLLTIVAVIIAVSHKRKTKQMSPSKKGYSSYYNAMWEDGVTLSYINNHIELPKDNPEEMVSLDDDTFLHSLDVTGFNGYWADKKNTKL